MFILIFEVNGMFKGTVLITGASSGIGKKVAIESVKAGYRVILLARRVEKLEKVQADCFDIRPNSALFFKMDLLDINQVDDVISHIIDNYIVDILINSAGIGLSKRVLESSFSDMERVFKINTLGLMYISKRLAASMVNRKRGHIIQVASLAGKVASPKTAVYSASKAAVIAFSNALRLELAPYNIYVTSVNTGPVDTDFFQKFQTSEEYRQAMKYLTLTDNQVSEKIVKSYMKNKREVNLPLLLNIGSKIYPLMPRLSDWLISNYFQK